MRPFAVLVATALLAGCAAREEPFDRVDAPLLVAHMQNLCGPCHGGADFQAPEFETFMVFGNGRAVLVHHNVAEGDALQVASGVAFDRATLSRVLDPLAEAFDAGSVAWVADVETGTLAGDTVEALETALATGWRAPVPGFSNGDCVDCAGFGRYAREVGGAMDVLDPAVGGSGAPQQDFEAVAEAMRNARDAFRPAVGQASEQDTRLVLIKAGIVVEALDGGMLPVGDMCADARYEGGRLHLPLMQHSPVPPYVVLRTLATTEGAVEVVGTSDHTVADAARPMTLTGLPRTGGGDMTVVVEQGAIVVDGTRVSGGPLARDYETILEGWDEETGEDRPRRFHVRETLSVQDLGAVPVTASYEDALCAG